jgi:hypothetical protein
MADKVKLAIMYDFDKTLCTKDMQEYSFIPKVNMSVDDFWAKATKLAKENKMDRILAYMYLMIKEARHEEISITRNDFVDLGKDLEFYEGVESWFKRIDAYAKANGVVIEHYIISSGLKEIIEGSSIYENFQDVFACEFFYDGSGVASWPKNVVNYTTKTQFLFRINKGVLDLSNDDDLNKYTATNERNIPFRNMIYIGDGLTDVPCMKLVKINGGTSIAVYKKRRTKIVKDLLCDNRVNYLEKADYTEGSELEKLVKDIILNMKGKDLLEKEQAKQLKSL